MMKKILFVLLIGVFFIGCRGNVPINNSSLDKSLKNEQVCYKFDKNDFQSSKDIIINTTSIDNEYGFVGLELGNLKNNYYEHVYECDFNDNNFQCSKEEGIEKFQLKTEDDNAYLHVDYLQISEDSSPIIYRIKSKDSSFSKGVKTSCYSSVKPIIEVENLKRGSKKEKLLNSININDVIIYDLDYYKDFIVAVGEDNSPQIRADLYRIDNYASLIIISRDGGKTWKKVQKKSRTYYDKVLVLDDKSIIVASFSDEVGGSIEASFDGGLSWKNVLYRDDERVYGDMFVSLEKIDKEIVAIRETGVIVKSKDNGKSWYTVEKKEEKNLFDDSLAVLTKPEYIIDYKNGNIIVLHRIKYRDCDKFTLPLTYNPSNTKKGLLGVYWSLGIEEHIDVQSETKLVFFNAKKGEKIIYLRDKNDKSIFYNHGSTSIKKTDKGYMRECNKSKYYFNPNGFLTKIEYQDKSYKIYYKDNKIDKIEELIDGKSYPYISFDYKYEGVTVNFYHTTNKKAITFLRGKDDLLSGIIDGNKHIFRYTYNEESDVKKKKLIEIEDPSKLYVDSILLSFDYGLNKYNKTTIYDYINKSRGIVIQKSYISQEKEKEHICFVSTLRMKMKKDLIENVETSMDIYTFNYYDIDKKNLLSTQYRYQIYGFDKLGRLNFYANGDNNTSIKYSEFNKALESLVYKKGELSKYKYTYTKDNDHKVKTVTSPEGLFELSYDKQNNVKEMKIGKYHIKYDYYKNGKYKKIILVGRGEIVISYDNKNEIKDIKYVSFSKDITSYDISSYVSNAMQLLVERTSMGSIKTYPFWLW